MSNNQRPHRSTTRHDQQETLKMLIDAKRLEPGVGCITYYGADAAGIFHRVLPWDLLPSGMITHADAGLQLCHHIPEGGFTAHEFSNLCQQRLSRTNCANSWIHLYYKDRCAFGLCCTVQCQ